MAASSLPRITGSASQRVIARTRSGSTAATVRRIRSAIRRPEFDRSGLDNRLAVARGYRERPLSRAQPGDGMAARRFGRPDGTRAARGRPSARDAACDPSLCAAGHARRMAAPDPDRRQPARDWFRHLSAGQSAPPAALARIPPTQLALWSFAVAIAHGAGLMLVPIYLGLCLEANPDRSHEAAGSLINANLGMAVLVSAVHAAAMIAAGGCLAWLVYRYLGLKFVSRSWFNLETVWAVSLILVGGIALVLGVS